MTDSPAIPPQSPQGSEAQASLRAQLLVELLSAQSDLAELLQALRQDGADAAIIASGEQQLLGLNGLQRQLAEGTMPLSALKQAISASVASASGLVQQGRAHATLAREAEMAALHAASTEARQVAQGFLHDFYEKRIFDPYLTFDGAEDERAYREREAARQKAIQAALEENTPEGQLRALDIIKQQMDDAKAHGADQSPDFKSQYDKIEAAQRGLAASLPKPASGLPSQSAEPTMPSPIAEQVEIDPAALAALQQAGVLYADQTQQGHGVAEKRTNAAHVRV